MNLKKLQDYSKLSNKFNYIHKEALSAKFIKSYDSQYLNTKFQDWQTKGQLEFEFIGAGQHFQAYKLRCLELDIVVKLGRHPKAWNKRWMANLDRLRMLNLPHIPPFKIVIDSEFEAVMQVMPFGKDAPVLGLPEGALNQSLEGIQLELSEAGLVLDDVQQVKWIEDVPYIIDLSSLIAL